MNFDERDLYSGLATLHWAAISETDSRWDQAFYQRLIEQNGGLALELGCGAGRLLIAYLQAGLPVEGCDLSGEMLAVCRQKAEEVGLQPVLYEQPMQQLSTPKLYRTIYIPCGSFVCVMDRTFALQTLQRCYQQLEAGGTLAFNIYLADYDYSGNSPQESFPQPWKLRAEKVLPHGRRLVVSHRLTARDPVEQIEQEERRYELYEGEQLVQSEMHSGQTRWYFRNELLWMLQLAGFRDVIVTGDYTDETFNASHKQTMVFMAKKEKSA